MKKFWKNMCLGAMALTSVVGFSGCGKDNDNVSVDLDNDGVVSEWETVFGSAPSSNRATIANVVNISTLAELKAINDNSANETTDMYDYRLVKDIDCKGETLSINLGKSKLFGNNRVIKNFKLGTCPIFGEEEGGESVSKGLFYNGVAVYDLRLFMGNQKFEINEDTSEYNISPFVNVPVLNTITVKGKLTISRRYTDNNTNISLLASSVEEKRSGLSISNCSVIGDIDYKESDSSATVYAGGIAAKLWANDLIYNSTVDGDFVVNGTMMNVGLVAGVSDGFVSTVNTKGSVATSYYSVGNSAVGGVVGFNSRNGEIKNATTTATISFDQDTLLSSNAEFAVGGMAGRNNGIISYSTSDAKLNISKCDATTYVGSVAGYGEHSIYYNVIGRGELNVTKCPNVFVADLVGYSKYGHFEKIITNARINVDNSTIDSKVNLGLVTIFEKLGGEFDSEAKYNAEYTPNFKSILIGGGANVYTKNAISAGDFRYNLGLRNEYEYYVLDENGEIETTPVLGEDNKPLLDENGDEIREPVTDTLTPYLYSKLYILDNYTVNKYKSENGLKTQEANLILTYAKDGSNSPMVVTNSSSVALQLQFFLRDLGFNYIIGNNEIDLSSFEMDKFKFTISKDMQLERYFRFDHKEYNGDLSPFDKEFDKVCSYDINDEMFSYLNKLITSNTTSEYTPLLISKEFATSMYLEDFEDEDTEEDIIPEEPEYPVEDEEDEDSSGEEDEEEFEDPLTVEKRFILNVTKLLEIMRITVASSTLASDYTVISEDNIEGLITKYIRLYFNDDKYNYTITFDVTEMAEDTDRERDNYVIYMDYHKDNKSMTT